MSTIYPKPITILYGSTIVSERCGDDIKAFNITVFFFTAPVAYNLESSKFVILEPVPPDNAKLTIMPSR